MKLCARLLSCLIVAATLLVPATVFAGEDGDKDSPVAGAVSAVAQGADSARVSGVVQLGKGSALYWFEYGTTPALGMQSAAATASHEEDDGQHRVLVARTLTGLAPGTTYHVRLVAASDVGRSSGPVTDFTTAAAPADQPAPSPEDPPAAPAPATEGALIGERFVAEPARGSVRVRLPGAGRFVALPGAATVPVGTVVDARQGALAMATALPGGGLQHATFGGGRFKVRQPATAGGRTDLYLRGGSFAACRARTLASAASAGRKPPVRRLWGKDRGGRFRTHGRDSVTTVRGTEWSVADRCAGTVTRVSEGAVDVRVRRTGRVVRVEAGKRFVARHRG